MRVPALLLVLSLLAAGCLQADPAALEPAADEGPAPEEPARTVYHSASSANGSASAQVPTNATDAGAAVPGATPIRFPAAPVLSAFDTGRPGAEPSVGVTKSGAVFFQAYTDTLRSLDGGHSWDRVNGPLSPPTTLDPFLWADPDTGRIFSNQLYVGCSWMSMSDDDGKTWTENPIACGLPVNDHQKITTGKPRTLTPTGYPNLVYYAYNALAGSRVAVSLDGGLTWPITSQSIFPASTCSGGLHGALHADADGILYLPKRDCGGSVVAVSKDNGLTWAVHKVGTDVGSAECRKNTEITTDVVGNAYVTWPGKDNRLYMAVGGAGTGEWSTSVRVSAPDVLTTTMPVLQAGDEGRVAFAYYGTRAEGRGPDEVPEDARWHLFVTYTLDGLSPDPAFVTVQVTPDNDPVQIGPISTNSACAAPQGSRNLLDFIDMVMDAEGRVYVAYADGCTSGCADRPDATMADSRDDRGYVAILQTGPSLLATIDVLTSPPTGASEA